jgi:uncharacterized membrane protein
MEPVLQEWLNLIVRWAHVVAAIMWIGDSFLFMWLDSKLSKPERPREGDVVGELWMAHSGGFYEVVKRRSLEVLPRELFWFKWESYTTWITGFLLLIIVYWLGGKAMLLDTTSELSHGAAVGLSFGSLAVATAVYHALCQTPLAHHYRIFGLVGLGLVAATAYGLGLLLTPRATFLQVGAMLGTIMASNVFFIIIPAQRHMLASTAAGTPVDTRYGARAKSRSTHNHYLTLPVLFTMLSNHFPSFYGHAQGWLVLTLMAGAGAGVKYAMNFRAKTPAWVWVGTALCLGTTAWLTAPASSGALREELAELAPVSFATAEAIVQARCVTCHAAEPANPAYAAPPQGIMLETAAQMQAHAERMFVNAVQNHTMPLGNLTEMKDEERTMLGAWIVQGADIHAPGPVQLTVSTQPTAAAQQFATPAEEAAYIYSTRCTPCHGKAGQGDGAGAATLKPPPRNYADPAWQASVTDDYLAKVIVEGGAAVGKSGNMPPSSDLASKPEVVAAMVKMVRQFGAAGGSAP